MGRLLSMSLVGALWTVALVLLSGPIAAAAAVAKPTPFPANDPGHLGNTTSEYMTDSVRRKLDALAQADLLKNFKPRPIVHRPLPIGTSSFPLKCQVNVASGQYPNIEPPIERLTSKMLSKFNFWSQVFDPSSPAEPPDAKISQQDSITGMQFGVNLNSKAARGMTWEQLSFTISQNFLFLRRYGYWSTQVSTTCAWNSNGHLQQPFLTMAYTVPSRSASQAQSL